MTTQRLEKFKIFFSESHHEQLAPSKEDEIKLGMLKEVLDSLNFEILSLTEMITSSCLENAHIFVIGAPESNSDAELTRDEINHIENFVRKGGGLLLIANSRTMFNPPDWLNELANMVNIKFQEYHNHPQKFLEIFEPHYISANLRQVKIGKIASVKASSPASLIAFTDTTKESVIAGAKLGLGRVLAVGDINIFTDDILDLETENKQELITNQRTLITNILVWLSSKNLIDIENMDISPSVKWGEQSIISLQLSNCNENLRPQIECVLESWKGVEISERAQKISIPSYKPTILRWSVKPLTLGEQELRLSIYPEDFPPLYFDHLPEMHCIVPGYFTVETLNSRDELKTDFLTNEPFKVVGIFHRSTETEKLPYHLELEFGEGLKEYQTEEKNEPNKKCWYLQAIKPGPHTITVKLLETGQSFSAVITVKSSIEDRLIELMAAHVRPLEAEIIERLKQLNILLIDENICKQPFNILLPEQFIDAVYKEKDREWLKELVKAGRREQRYNFELLNLILTYITPTYLPHYGTFIPYDPALADHLIKLHLSQERYIVTNFLSSEETDDIQVKQNIAAYLLHEKFGHGFFYHQTTLGKQLKILHINDIDDNIINLIEDSALIVNEGFAVWLELTFLLKLNREIRQAAKLREILLIDESEGLYRKEQTSEFFQKFPPKFDSRYREGFEYFDFISRKFNPCCVIQALIIATDIDFGITNDSIELGNIRSLILDSESSKWRSQQRLEDIANLLYKDQDAKKIRRQIQRQHCHINCSQNLCLLETFIADKLKWRQS